MSPRSRPGLSSPAPALPSTFLLLTTAAAAAATTLPVIAKGKGPLVWRLIRE